MTVPCLQTLPCLFINAGVREERGGRNVELTFRQMSLKGALRPHAPLLDKRQPRCLLHYSIQQRQNLQIMLLVTG